MGWGRPSPLGLENIRGVAATSHVQYLVPSKRGSSSSHPCREQLYMLQKKLSACCLAMSALKGYHRNPSSMHCSKLVADSLILRRIGTRIWRQWVASQWMTLV